MVIPTISLREINPLNSGGGNGCLRSGRLDLLIVNGEFIWLLKRNADLLVLMESLDQKRYVLKRIPVQSPSLYQSVSKVR